MILVLADVVSSTTHRSLDQGTKSSSVRGFMGLECKNEAEVA